MLALFNCYNTCNVLLPYSTPLRRGLERQQPSSLEQEFVETLIPKMIILEGIIAPLRFTIFLAQCFFLIRHYLYAWKEVYLNSTFIFVLGHAGVVGNEREDMTSGFCYYNRWSSYGCSRHCERSLRVWQEKNARPAKWINIDRHDATFRTEDGSG